MRDRFVHYHDDPTGITEWFAGKTLSVGRTVPSPTPAPIPVPSPAPAPVEAPQAIVAARKKPIPRPGAESCGHCGNPQPSIRSARKAFCNRHCARAARAPFLRPRPHIDGMTPDLTGEDIRDRAGRFLGVQTIST
jgi:hypothetical protein